MKSNLFKLSTILFTVITSVSCGNNTTSENSAYSTNTENISSENISSNDYYSSESESSSSEETSSISNSKQDVSLIAPSGSPLLAISSYLYENKNVKYEVSNGSDPLVSAFSTSSHDIIVAPINLGLNFYNKTSKYVLFETIVWGNLYVVSRNPMENLEDLNNKTLTIFGTNQTPDILMNTFSKEYNLTYDVNRVDSVENANSLFLAKQTDYIISAEPSLSKVKEKCNNEKLYIIDLQEEWKKMTQKSSYPQAGVFVKKDKVNDLKDELNKIKSNINSINDDLDYQVSCAMETPLKSLGENTIKSALPNCHIGIDENQKDAIKYYFEKLLDLGLEKTFGEKLPDEAFYI